MSRTLEKSVTSTYSFQKLGMMPAQYLNETPLYFNKGAMDIDPKRGLSMHGPVDSSEDVQTIRVGIISDSEGTQNVTLCLDYLNDNAVKSRGESPFTTLAFPGFEKAFNARLIFSPQYNEMLLSKDIDQIMHIENPNLRIRKASQIYLKKAKSICDRVVVPDVIICHKTSVIERECEERRIRGLTQAEKKKAEEIKEKVRIHRILAPLSEDTKDFIGMSIKANFRRILKSELAKSQAGVPTQILRQSSLEELNTALKIPNVPAAKHKKQDPATIAWNLSVALYYKSNHFPWRVGNLQGGSCYIGVSFFVDKSTSGRNMFASLAQIFTDTGEGLILSGDSFSWDTKKQGHPHLTEDSARKLLKNAIRLYQRHHNEQLPNRVVLHKSSKYTKEESQGFLSALGDVPRYDFVTIRSNREISFFRNGDEAVFSLLWTRKF